MSQYRTGMGWGSCITIRLPVGASIDNKPENRFEIHNSAYSKSGVIIRLLVANGEEVSELRTQKSEDLMCSTAILKYLFFLGIILNKVPVLTLF